MAAKAQTELIGKCASLALAACLALAATSCTTPPTHDDGLVGMMYEAAHRKAAVRYASGVPYDPPRLPAAGSVEGAAADTGGAGPAPEPLRYRTSPGDVLQAAFFRGSPSLRPFEYAVECDDVLTINVTGQKTYSTDVTVRPDGKISFYLIGDVEVRGRTISQVREEIVVKFREVIPAAEITVILKQGNVMVDQFLQALASDSEGFVRTLRVRSDGHVNLPLIGEVKAVGKTMRELSVELEHRYREVFGAALSVTLNMITSNTGNVAILGEVKNPGVFTVSADVHPLHALAMAGGGLDTANLKDAVLIKRQPDGSAVRYRVNLAAPLAAHGGDLNIALGPRDILVVPRSGVANANLFVDQYLTKMIPFRLGAGAYYDLND
jgi:protein involved in polysaccharide export with SLBB domain